MKNTTTIYSISNLSPCTLLKVKSQQKLCKDKRHRQPCRIHQRCGSAHHQSSFSSYSTSCPAALRIRVEEVAARDPNICPSFKPGRVAKFWEMGVGAGEMLPLGTGAPLGGKSFSTLETKIRQVMD